MADEIPQDIVAEIDARQEAVLRGLEELNARIEKVIEEYSPKLSVVSPAA